MDKFVALLFSGIAFGGISALVALGFVSLHKATGVVNFAHGDLVTLGAYLAYWLIVLHQVPTAVAYVVAVLLLFVGGLVLERLAFAPLRSRPPLVVVISTLGASVVIRSAIGIWLGTEPKRLPGPVGNDAVRLFGAAIAEQRVLIIGVSALVIPALLVLFHKTSFGRQVRAMAADREVAQLYGVRLPLLSLASFGLSAALAAVAGILIAPLGALTLSLGFTLMFTAFGAAIVGGFGSIGGVALAALLLGIVQQVVAGYFFQGYEDLVPFVVILLVIAIRPQGLFGEASGVRL